jgi:hypothetical protein
VYGPVIVVLMGPLVIIEKGGTMTAKGVLSKTMTFLFIEEWSESMAVMW